MTVADHIIGKFGGLTVLSKELGHKNPTTVQGWKERGSIPSRHFPDILAAAKRLNVEINPEDFICPPGIEVTSAA